MACQPILTLAEMVTSTIPQEPHTPKPDGRVEILSQIQAIQASMLPPATSIQPEEIFDTPHKKEIRAQYRGLFGQVKCVLIAMEGTLFTQTTKGLELTPGAVEAYARLRKSRLKVLIVTNTWLKPKVRLLNKLGFPVQEKDLFTSSDCCKLFMKGHDLSHPLLLVSQDVLKDFPDMDTRNPLEFDSVLLGLPSTMIDYRLITKAMNILLEGHPLLILNSNQTEKSFGSVDIPGPGGYGHALTWTTDALRLTPAKPTVGFYVEAAKYAKSRPGECVMIGDSLTQDVTGPQSICMKTILVKTGRYRIGDESRICGVAPDLLLDNFYKGAMYVLVASGADTDKALDKIRDAERTAKWERETGDWAVRLRAYAQDCTNPPRKTVCPKKVDSILWY